MKYTVLGLIALALAGCITAKQTLSRDEIASFRPERVDVSFSSDSTIVWPEGGVAYASTKGLAATEAETVANTPEAWAYLRSGVAARVRTAMQNELHQVMRGSRPVVVQVVVRRVYIAHAIQRILVGGDNQLTADVVIVDAKSKTVLSRLDNQTIRKNGGEGLGGVLIAAAFLDPAMDGLAGQFASQYKRWLEG